MNARTPDEETTLHLIRTDRFGVGLATTFAGLSLFIALCVAVAWGSALGATAAVIGSVLFAGALVVAREDRLAHLGRLALHAPRGQVPRLLDALSRWDVDTAAVSDELAAEAARIDALEEVAEVAPVAQVVEEREARARALVAEAGELLSELELAEVRTPSAAIDELRERRRRARAEAEIERLAG